MPVTLTAKQQQAIQLLGGPEKHCLLYGGSRSGKTFLFLRAVMIRALAAAKSRHAILRFRFNHVKSSVVLDTFPKLMQLAFQNVPYEINKSDWFAEFPNGSQVWFGGLDDKARAEKILGQEHATIFLNECSQIPYSSRNIALTRLAQHVTHQINGKPEPLRLKMYYDENPPQKGHWTYQLFFHHRDPESKEPISDPENYAALQMNPDDNVANLPAGYLQTLESLPARMRLRFRKGEFADASEGALWTIEGIETYRVQHAPPLQRIVVAVDPSGAGDTDNAGNDAIGILVAGIGLDGIGYVLEDLTCTVGPSTWGNIATTAYDRHQADCIVGEVNYGGAMVQHVIKTSRRGFTPYKEVHASRGKAVRAEPIAALAEQGKIRHVGYFPELEDELCSFTSAGYMGGASPNRADAYVWAFSELFPDLVGEPKFGFFVAGPGMDKRSSAADAFFGGR